MRMPNRRWLLAALLVGVLGTGFGIWVLLHPASIFVQPWRAQLTGSSSSQVLFGPYPVEEDFNRLKQRGVTTIISLLEPRVPYEAELLAQERERAKRHGMRLLNFPMGSILGQTFGDDYVVNSRAAADAALKADGVAYIHCYLGLHRARNVQKYLDGLASSNIYAGVNSGAAADLDAEHEAQEAFDARDYSRSLAALARIPVKGLRTARLEAWNHYRLRQLPQAQAGFEAVLARFPDDLDAMTGLGYTALGQGRLDDAADIFAKARSHDDNDDDDISALEGLAFARYRQGRREEARVLLEDAVKRNPTNTETRAILDRLHATSDHDPPAQAAAH